METYKLTKMTPQYKGSTPMPDIMLTDDKNWHSVPIAALHTNIQNTLLNTWKVKDKFVMFKSELSYISICLHTRGKNCAILYFE